jgi:dolichol-phosphate mannosyltransferase
VRRRFYRQDGEDDCDAELRESINNVAVDRDKVETRRNLDEMEFPVMSTSVAAPLSPCSPRTDKIELAVVVPTYNERENVQLLLKSLSEVLSGIQWEVIFVDDNSPDGTANCIREIAMTDRRVRVIERIRRRGLSSACIEGMLATPAPYIAVMDADLQHDEGILPAMLEKMTSEKLDVVVASRNLLGGSMGAFSSRRIWLSKLGNRISNWVCHCHVSDAMSGFFLVERTFFMQVAPRLSGTGFKILVDILASSTGPVRVGEVPYHFRTRLHGESKLDINTELEYLYLLLDKVIGNVVPTRFVLFLLVGSLGLLVHLGTLGLLYLGKHSSFGAAQVIATIVAMTFNFLLNNTVTFRDRRLHGWHVLTGLLSFYVACSLGAYINVSFAENLYKAHFPWYLAGLCGVAISSVWNYGVNTIVTWRRARVD